MKVQGAVDLLKDLYPCMMRLNLLDTSNYSRTHDLFNDDRNSKLGCIKDEFKGGICTQVVMLAPKCYSFKMLDGSVKSTAKGINRSLKKTLSHNDYLERFQQQNEKRGQNPRLRSVKH